MKANHLSLGASGTLLALLVLPLPSLAADQPSNLFEDGKPILDLRYRFEHVDQDNALRDGRANTLRARVGYQSGKWNGFSGLVEFDAVSHLDGDHFNDTRNGQARYSAIPDPKGSEVNQALIRYDAEQGNVVAGRQRINLDNQRFVGGVAWRQNEQTYDAALLQFKPLKALVFTYAYIDQVNTVFGPDNGPYAAATNPANIEGHGHLLNLQYRTMPELVATAYQYRLGLDNISVAAGAPLGTLSSTTTGLRLNGDIGAFGYSLEYARQKDYDHNPWKLDSHYLLAEAAYKVKGVQLKAGFESLGAGTGTGNRAFQTPLATKHIFNGWADVFLTTPADGLEDIYVGASAPLAGGTVQLWYHDFSSERGNLDFGNEFDVSYSHALFGMKGLNGLLKYARYASDDRSRTVDTDKLWVQVQYTY